MTDDVDRDLKLVELHGLQYENATLSMRIQVATAYAHLLHFGYDALLTHSIDFHKLPEYKRMDLILQTSQERNIDRSRTILLDWISDVESAILAAIRRKNMRVVT